MPNCRLVKVPLAASEADGAIWHFLQISTPRASLLYSLTFKLSTKHDSKHTLAGIRKFNRHKYTYVYVKSYTYQGLEHCQHISVSKCLQIFHQNATRQIANIPQRQHQAIHRPTNNSLTHSRCRSSKADNARKMRQVNFASSNCSDQL